GVLGDRSVRRVLPSFVLLTGLGVAPQLVALGAAAAPAPFPVVARETEPEGDAGAAEPPGDFRDTELVTLPNGLRVVLLRDPDAPVLSLCSTFDAGLRRDDPGAPGA